MNNTDKGPLYPGVIFTREYFPEGKPSYYANVALWQGVEYEFTTYAAAG